MEPVGRPADRLPVRYHQIKMVKAKFLYTVKHACHESMDCQS